MIFTQEKLRKNLTFIIALILATAVFVVSGIMLVDRLMPPSQNLDRFKTGTVQKTPEVIKNEEKLYKNPIDFKALRSENSDIYGWITVDGTKIDYPILRSGADKPEDFYLTHDYKCKEKRYGAIFMQRINAEDFTDSNTVLYGHNMMSGAMFGTLKKFRNKTFFDENRNIYVYAPNNIYRYEICAAYVADDRNIMMSYNFFTSEGYRAFIERYLTEEENKSALIKKDISVTDSDKIITLSTCTSNESERYIVVGRLAETFKTE